MSQCFARAATQVVMLVTCASSVAAAQRLPLWHRLEAGSYAVGMRVEYLVDYSRSWQSDRDSVSGAALERPRPIRVTVWYPAAPTRGVRMPFEGYLRYANKDPRFAPANEFLFRRDSASYLRGDFAGSSALYRQLMATPTAVHIDARRAPGGHPLILYAAGWNSLSPDNTVLAEYLASHGFVVATVPQLPTRATSAELSVSASELETQMRDLEWALGVVRAAPGVDPGHTVLMGYSMGGIASLWLAGRHAGIDALVGLDASFGASQWSAFAESSPSFDVRRIRMPILMLRSGMAGNAAQQSDVVIDSLHFADRFVSSVSSATHGEFSDYPAIALATGAPWDAATHSIEAANAAHELISQAVLRFMQSVSRDDSANRVMVSGASGIDMKFLRRAMIPTTAEIESMIRIVGYDSTRATLRAAQQTYPTLAIVDEGELNAAAYRMLVERRARDAQAVFRINTDFFPRSANAYDSMADGCIAVHDVAGARVAYRTALEIDPAYPNAAGARRFIAEHP